MQPTDSDRSSSPPAPAAAMRRHFHFDRVEVDAVAHTLVRDGQAVALEPKAFAVLLALLQHPGELLERDDLLDRVWGHRHVTPGVLTRAIAQLRAALDDDSHQPRYIQTQHGLGYRFIGQLQPPPGLVDAVAVPPPAALPAVVTATTSIGSAAAAGDVAVAPAASGKRRWRRVLAGAAVAMLLALGLLIWTRAPWRQPPAGASIAVMPFVNLSSNADDNYFAEGLAVEMHDALASVEGLKVAARMTAGDAGLHDLDARTLGQTLGVANVLEATVRRDGSRIRINARLINSRTGYTVWNQAYDQSMADVFATQSRIASDVATQLMGVLPDAGAGLHQRLTPTRDVRAYDAYLRGVQQLDPLAGQAHPELAISFFNQALASDKGFVLAQLGICRSEISRFDRLREAAAHDRAQQACQQAGRMAPGRADIELAMGDLHRINQSWQRAIASYRKAARDPARRADALIGQALVALKQERNTQALDYFEQALELRPGDARIYAHVSYMKYMLGDLDGAIDAQRKSIRLDAGDADSWANLGGMYQQNGDDTLAMNAYGQSLKIKPTFTVLTNLGVMEFDAGNYPGAVQLYQQAIQLESGDFLVWGNLADALLVQPAQRDAALLAYAEASRRAAAYLQKDDADVIAQAALGWYRAMLGDQRLALELTRRSARTGQANVDVAVFNAQAYLALGQVQAARQRIADAQRAGLSGKRLRANPLLDVRTPYRFAGVAGGNAQDPWLNGTSTHQEL
ncbi:winged helix-turn-helix domain-containing protein [Pseudoxanthomonas dokdonensis]|uniref:OmpR/PhoB-type domain-containing protein n=1 Tax=Pseudoxanthomonas dokdonensis TaxID=344882 RepID=A0A0R0CHK6_9GAMM|nr:winged helix-turn-helix domain-containing protein [Pseudoxanthomonas dokdonensis]KRG69045.1 hypothetical protein ABB29_11460 [Pseudoxanthomonas dokdonensis]